MSRVLGRCLSGLVAVSMLQAAFAAAAAAKEPAWQTDFQAAQAKAKGKTRSCWWPSSARTGAPGARTSRPRSLTTGVRVGGPQDSSFLSRSISRTRKNCPTNSRNRTANLPHEYKIADPASCSPNPMAT